MPRITRALGYNKTNHSTEELRKIYRFWLRGVETELQPQDLLGTIGERKVTIDRLYLSERRVLFYRGFKDRI